MHDSELSKQVALAHFRRRRRICAEIEKVNNAELHAGSPFYFYCKHCGVPTEVLPEDFLFAPTRECSQCQGLRKEGWLEEAIVLG